MMTPEVLTDEELIAAYRSGDLNCIEILIQRYKIFVRKKIKSTYFIGADREDLIQEGMIGLFKAICDYNPNKDTTFKSFATLCITRQLSTAFKTATRQKHMPLNTSISLNLPIAGEEEDQITLMDTLRDEVGPNPEELIIHQEDLKLLKSVGYDVDHTIFSFIPNTAEIAYYGMMQGLEAWLDRQKSEEICARNGQLSSAQIREILSRQIRTEKLAIKDIKLRTFIAEGNSRNDLAAHVYDTTYGTVREGVDSIVVIDDSIVRGTTLRQSIIKILCRQKPKKIVIVSSSPQIRYPDCYGIDMSKMGEFIAFHAAIALLKERRLERVIDEVYTKSKAQIALPKEKVVNYVKEIYAPFTDEEISAKIAEMITPENCPSEIAVVYQTIDHLHQACPNHSGDWYFSGDYPTPGGNRLVNGAFVEWYEKRFNS